MATFYAAAAHVARRAPARGGSRCQRSYQSSRLQPAHLIDLKTNGVGNADRAAPAETPAATARRHRPLSGRAKDGTWLGLRDAKRAPASMTDIVPEGAKFIDGTYGNKAGSRTYKRRRLAAPTRPNAGTGFARRTSAVTKASLR